MSMQLMRKLLESTGTGPGSDDTRLDSYLAQVPSTRSSSSSTGAVYYYAPYGPGPTESECEPFGCASDAKRKGEASTPLLWDGAPEAFDLDEAHEAYDDAFVGVAAGAVRQAAAGANAARTATETESASTATADSNAYANANYPASAIFGIDDHEVHASGKSECGSKTSAEFVAGTPPRSVQADHRMLSTIGP